jgi:hypothetical protein
VVLQCQYKLKICLSDQGDHRRNFIKEAITDVYSLLQHELFRKIKNTSFTPMNVGLCHHGMARPEVADGGTASNMEDSCE